MPLDHDASGLEDILGTSPNSIFQTLADAGFLPDLIPILPPDACLTAASAIEHKDRGKIPGQYLHNGTWRGFPRWTHHVATAATIDEWSTWPACGCGVIGRQTKAFDLDILDQAFAERADEFLVQLLGSAPCRIGRPPRRLLVYRCDVPLGKAALVLKKDGKESRIEFLGSKQQFVVAGIHPKTGKAYHWPRGDLTAIGLSGLTPITPSQADEALTALETMAVAEGYEVVRLGRVKTVGETLDIQIPDYLPTDAINAPRARNAFERHLLKWSAGIAEGQRDDAVYQCAASLFDFIADKDIVSRWMKAELWPLIDGDDFTEAQFDKCVEQGRICRQNVTGAYAAGAAQDVFGKAAISLANDSSASVSDDEDPLNVFDNEADNPEFPSGALPAVLEDFVRDEAARKGVDVGTIVLPALVACAGALHSQFQIQHTNDTSWTQRPVLWGMLVGDPSTVKTPILTAVMKPLESLQRHWFHQDKMLFAQYKRSAAEHDAAFRKKLDNIKFAGPEVASTLAGSDVGIAPVAPAKRQLIVKNATVEALADVLAGNDGRGVLSYRNELAGWITSFDRYAEKKGGDQAHWLEAWDSAPQIINRVSKKEGPTFIENWSISVLGGIQPSRLKPMAAQLSEDGLLQRFLIAWASQPRRAEDRAPGAATGAYAALLRRIADLKPIAEAGQGYVPIRLSAEAREHWLRVQEHIQDKLTIHRESHGAFCEHLGKWPNQFARLLLVLHAIEGAAEMPSATLAQPKLPLLVSGATAQRAARLAIRFLIPSAERFYKEVFGFTAEWGHVQWIASYILTSGPEKTNIRPRDIYRNYRALNTTRREHARELQEAMQSLEYRNWVKPIESMPGRGTVVWEINPRVHAHFADLAQSYPAIVTNKHVIEGQARGFFHITMADASGAPKYGSHEGIELGNFPSCWIEHPDAAIDLAVCPIGPLFHHLKQLGKTPFYMGIPPKIIPDATALAGLNAIEDVLMIGYPNGLWDAKNNVPIVRRGVTATPLFLDYQERTEFLIDAACFPGSSGSPVFIVNQGFVVQKNGGISVGKSRTLFLGVLYAGPQITTTGKIVVQSVPTSLQPVPVISTMMNLGMCIKAARISDFEPLLRAKGFGPTVPSAA